MDLIIATSRRRVSCGISMFTLTCIMVSPSMVTAITHPLPWSSCTDPVTKTSYQRGVILKELKFPKPSLLFRDVIASHPSNSQKLQLLLLKVISDHAETPVSHQSYSAFQKQHWQVGNPQRTTAGRKDCLFILQGYTNI